MFFVENFFCFGELPAQAIALQIVNILWKTSVEIMCIKKVA